MRKECTLEWVDDNGNVIPNGITPIKAEPCKSVDQNVADVPSGDLISRADTIEMLLSFKESRAKGVSTYDIGFVDGLSHAINMIDLVPSAEYSKPLQTTLNGDLISRQDALMELNGVCSNWQDDTKVAEIIKALPSAEKKEGEYADEIARRIATIIENEQDMRVILESADRPKGEWIKNDDFTCSECGYRMIVGDGAYNFCPNCGADMRGDVM